MLFVERAGLERPQPRLAPPPERAGVRRLRSAAVLLRRAAAGARSALALVALNRRFYALLVRRRGGPRRALGVALHALHHLVGIAAASTALAMHLGRALAALAAGEALDLGSFPERHVDQVRAPPRRTSPSSRYSASVFTDQTSWAMPSM